MAPACHCTPALPHTVCSAFLHASQPCSGGTTSATAPKSKRKLSGSRRSRAAGCMRLTSMARRCSSAACRCSSAACGTVRAGQERRMSWFQFMGPSGHERITFFHEGCAAMEAGLRGMQQQVRNAPASPLPTWAPHRRRPAAASAVPCAAGGWPRVPDRQPAFGGAAGEVERMSGPVKHGKRLRASRRRRRRQEQTAGPAADLDAPW